MPQAGTSSMRQPFRKDDLEKPGCNGFVWANTLFGELILKIKREHLNWLSRAL